MKPSVTIVGHEASRTGAPLLLVRLLQHADLSSLNVRIDLLRGGPLLPDYAALYPTRVLPNQLTFRARWFAWLQRRPDLYCVHSHAYKFLHTAKRRDVPVVCSVHEGAISFCQIPVETLKLLATYPIRTIANSQTVRSLLIQNGTPPERITVMTPAVDAAHWMRQSDGAEVRRRLSIPPHALVVGGSGQIHPRKGTDLWIQTAAALRHLLPEHDIHFIWMGSAPPDQLVFAQLLQGDVKRLGLQGRVHFLEDQVDPRPVAEVFDVFAMASREEPFGMVLLENGALGTPCVAFAVAGGPGEFLDASDLAPEMSPQSLAETLLPYLRDEARRKASGSVLRERVIAKYDLQEAANQFASLLTETVAELLRRPRGV